MNARLLAAACLLLAGCTAGGAASPTATPTSVSTQTPATPSNNPNEEFCDAVVAWGASTDAMSLSMDALGELLHAVDDPEDASSTLSLHLFASSLLGSADAADAAMADALAEVDDPEVAAQMTQIHDLMLGVPRWMGEAARDSEDVAAFSAVILGGLDLVEETIVQMEALDATEADAFVEERCGFDPGFTASGGASVEDA